MRTLLVPLALVSLSAALTPLAHAQAPAATLAPDPAPVAAPVAAPAAVTTPVAAAATPGAPLTVAVLDLRGQGPAESLARALTVVVTSEIAATPGFKAVSRNDLKNLLEHQADAQLLGCAEVKCMADIAKLVAADRVVAGSVEKVENAYVFGLELIDPVAPRVLERQTVTWKDSPDRMVELVRPYVGRLLAGAQAQAHEGQAEVVAPAGAKVVIDGKEVGTAPIKEAVRGLPSGSHDLLVTQDGFVPLTQQFVVVRGETTLLRPQLIDEESQRPWYAKWWVWGAVGGGVAVVGGAAATVAVLAVMSQPNPTTLSIDSKLPIN